VEERSLDSFHARSHANRYATMQPLIDYKIMSESPLFSGIDSQSLQNMFSTMHRDHWPRGFKVESLRLKRRFYILLKGRVKVSRYHPDSGRELILFLLGPGEAVNCLNLIDNERCDLQISTLDEVEVLSASTEQWLEWMGKHQSIHKAMTKIETHQVEHLSNLVSELAFDNTMTRLTGLLLRYLDRSKNTLKLIHDLSQEELAHMIGSVRPVVARLLGELRREGVIGIYDGKIRVLNQKSLEACVFRAISNTHSERSRTPIPI